MSSDIIRQLPDSVANQIAAGEVIQRPASVVKELVENSVDAKATKIDIKLKDAGRTLVQISDDGIGMSATDARMSFARHSTSKISCADDLFSLRTMGFRGEALASIAAISQVELRTQRHDDSIGTLIELAGKDCKQEPVMYGKGTCFKIKNIFYNVPARRKFLKSNQVELSNILREFERLALINESIDFTISNNDTLIHSLNAGSFKHRIVSLFGRTLDKQLVPVSVDTSIIKIEGFISMPEFSRKKNYLQYLFVNGRYMKHPYFHKAILTCFEQMIPHENQPNYFLKFTVDPQTIDVNIHPTKTEIKFENEQLIWPIIMAAVKEAVGKYSTAPSINFNNVDVVEIPVLTKGTKIIDPGAMKHSDYNPFKTSESRKFDNPHRSKDVPADWNKLYDSFLSDKYGGKEESLDYVEKRIPQSKDSNFDSDISANVINVVENGVFDSIDSTTNNYIQIHGRFIVTPVKSGLMVIDQHRAHLMILYHNLLHQQSLSGSVASQSVIFPELIEVTADQNSILHNIKNDLQNVGLKISEVENLTWKIESIPVGLNNLNSKENIYEILDAIKSNVDRPEQNIKLDLLYELAKRSAIQYGTKLSQDEMDSIVGQLLAIPSPNYAPNGKVIIKIISIDQLNKLFL